MKLQTHASSGGIALIIVMIVIIVLGIMAGGFAYSMKVETTLARRANADPDLEWLGRSGVELARYILAQPVPNEPFDALNQKWAGGPGSYTANNLPLGGVPDPLSQISLENNQLGGGHFSIKITDLERKANVNLADQGLLQQALFLVGVDPSSMSTIIDSVLDWRDPDDNPHINGTESEYYLKQDPPYVAKNGPIDDLSELLLIRGITPEMYWGPRGSNSGGGLNAHAITRSSRPLGAEPVGYQAGLVDLFTAISARQINVNTASAAVLRLVLGDDFMVQEILRQRAGLDGVDGTEDDIPFRSPQEIPLAGAGAQPAARLNNVFTVRSVSFEVQVDAEMGKIKKQFVAVLRRNSPRDIQVLYMYAK